MQEIKVDKEENERLDTYLTKYLYISRSKIQKLIKEEKILVNNHTVNNSYMPLIGDIVQILEEEKKEKMIESIDIPIEVLYENDDLLVINKPSGLVVHPGSGNLDGTLVNALYGKYKLSTDDVRPGIVHRLDKDTSGVLIVAKNDWAHEKLSSMFKNHEIKKTYLAFVLGTFPCDSGTIDAPIGRDNTSPLKMMVTSLNSKNAITHFRVLKRFHHYSLLECDLETGRTHQIRVHLSYIKHPIFNDPLYGTEKEEGFGQLLHAQKIEFLNPRDNKKIIVEKEPPKEFYEIINKYLDVDEKI